MPFSRSHKTRINTLELSESDSTGMEGQRSEKRQDEKYIITEEEDQDLEIEGNGSTPKSSTRAWLDIGSPSDTYKLVYLSLDSRPPSIVDVGKHLFHLILYGVFFGCFASGFATLWVIADDYTFDPDGVKRMSYVVYWIQIVAGYVSWKDE
eukprot:TRINITY_DN2137_c0_g4_i6.p1 TRINITY_DN2137_c0_g4~~TRINITY_DN2137_c0_g4_i6.p1  ORF type:complete len:151 (-),score=20.45 TRINITY_DN2137_c0_g4_i6:479-931(-)